MDRFMTQAVIKRIPTIDVANLLFMIIGILFIIYELYLDVSAKFELKIFKSVGQNKFMTGHC